MSKSTQPAAPGCDEYDPNSLSVSEAHTRIMELAVPVDGEEQLLIREALGRVLASDVISPLDVPPYPNSAMDGYAVRSADLPADGTSTLQVIGTSWAGDPFTGEVGQSQCVRIMTGAKMANGSDTVIMQEHVEHSDDAIRIGPGHRAGQNVRHPGEDIKQGSAVLAAGTKIDPAELGVLASLGIAEVTVRRRLRVAFFSTGDELRPVGEPLRDGQIYDSNRYTLYGMLTRLDVELVDMGVIRDQREAVEAAFREAGNTADVVITSGGVSVGDADYVKETVDRIGEVGFWKIAMKPGKPLAFGKVGDAVFFGLPGNPVSVMATFCQLVAPALRHMTGQHVDTTVVIKVRCESHLKKRPGRVDFQRGRLRYDDSGELVVSSTGLQGSHVLTSMSNADCFIILPADQGDVEPGSIVDVQPFAGLI
ncbi:MAG: molybdopterin molybdotransferase MoeA [Pseudomonadota bacterium]|nr:MAG: molybdopterin molybdotransferase MoeA [Pseudomonadota bacterium]